MREVVIERNLIYLQDFPSVRAVHYFQQRDIVSFLAEYIIDWSLSVEIKPSTVARLSWNRMKDVVKIANDELLRLEQDTKLIFDGLDVLIGSKGRVHLMPNHPLLVRYAERLRVCLPAVDNECNLITLPSGNNIETMRYDDFVLIEAIITAKNHALEKEQKRNNRR